MKHYNGEVETNFFWIIPFLIGVSESVIQSSKSTNSIFALHITPFLEICFNYRKNK